jgi:hypothetical protein
MDTDTVQKIIEMLDARISNYELNIKNPDVMLVMSDCGAIKALKEFGDHLQKYKHSLQNQVENDMNRGE